MAEVWWNGTFVHGLAMITRPSKTGGPMRRSSLAGKPHRPKMKRPPTLRMMRSVTCSLARRSRSSPLFFFLA